MGSLRHNGRSSSLGRLCRVLVMTLLLLAPASISAPQASARGDANAAGCPNEALPGFRAYLPDCRAYEQVTPVFKDGFQFFPEALTADGSHLLAESPGLVAGTTGGNCTFHHYELQRSGVGWTVSALADASVSEFLYAKPCIVTPINNEGAAILAMRPLSHSVYELDLYRREPTSTLQFIGPMRPPGAVPPTPVGGLEEINEVLQISAGALTLIGASRDFSHVLFTLVPRSETLPPGVKSELWPGDTTTLKGQGAQRSSLYEYVGQNKQVPALVGIDNAGQLISDCSTELGGGGPGPNEGNHRNAISADGSRLFYTATGANRSVLCSGVEGPVPPVEEIFARTNNGQPQSPVDAQGKCTVAADACTVAISQPKALSATAPNAGCMEAECQKNTTEETDFRGANFEGASADGAKAFFTSPQQLLDSATQDPTEDRAVGTLGGNGCEAATGAHGCNLYEYNFGEKPATQAPVGLMLLSGGDSSGLGSEVQGVAAIAEDGSRVYFVAKGVLSRGPRGGATREVGGEEIEGPCLAELGAAEKAEERQAEEQEEQKEVITTGARCRPRPGQDNLYVSDTTSGRTSFIATLSSQDKAQWYFEGEGESTQRQQPMNVTDDGRFVVFSSTEHLTSDETSENAISQVFRYEAATGALVRVSIGNEGFNHDGNAALGEVHLIHASTHSTQVGSFDRHPAVSEDGTTVVFESSEALVPGALDNRCVEEEAGTCLAFALNVYEYREGHVYPISDGHDAAGTEVGGYISPSGTDIFIGTTDSLVPQDTDTLGDVYDARVGGGFPAPTTGACEGEGCQGAPTTAPSFGVPGSATFSGSGNLNSSPPVSGPAPKRPTRAQKLAAALKACRTKHSKHKRKSCEAQARTKYGSSSHKRASPHKGGR
jgi:hypothetical protein